MGRGRMLDGSRQAPPPANGGGQRFEGGHGVVPAEAGVGDGLAAGQRLEVSGGLLAAFDQIGFDHHCGDDLATGSDLVGDVADDQRLAAEILERIAVRAIDHH